MKKAFGIMLSLMTVISMQTAALAALPAINSDTYVVMEVKSGQVLASRGADKIKYPASITKILTCAIALENGDPDDRHTMTYKATHSIEPGSTHIALTEEEVVTVRDLLKATMIESANDAANGLAEYIAGDIDAFPALMNEKAAEIGAENSNFVNAHGLPDDNHYTTAYDMALITRWALGVEGFRELFGDISYVVPPTNKQASERNIGTHHLMLVDSAYYYEGTTGGKLGWTTDSRHTMVTLCEKNGMELICVVMDSHPQYEKFKDAINLLDHCYENYTISEMKLTRFEDEPIPVVDDEGVTVAEVVIPEQSFFVVHSPQLARADITPELLSPERYHEEDSIEPTLIFTDDEGNALSTVRLEWDYRQVEPQAAVDAQPEQGFILVRGSFSFDLRWLWLIPILLVIALIVLLLIRRRNLRLRELRRMEKRRMLQELLDRQMEENIGFVNRSDPATRISFRQDHKITSMNRTVTTRPKGSAGRPKMRGREGYRK